MSQRAIYVWIVTKYDSIWYTGGGVGGIIGKEVYAFNVQAINSS